MIARSRLHPILGLHTIIAAVPMRCLIGMKKRWRSFDKALSLTLELAGIKIVDGISLVAAELSGELRERLHKALAADANSIDTLNNRGQVLNRLKRHDEAIGSFARSLALRSDQPDALCQRGEALAAVDRFNDALTDFAEALRIDPNCADAHLKRGNALYGLN